MLQAMFRKWWVILLQGILLIILGIYIFNNPGATLAGLSLWFGVVVLISGILGVIHWFSSDKDEREGMSLFWSLVTVLFGVLMLGNLLATMKTLTILFGIWMLLTGIWLVRSGWSIKSGNTLGWIMVLVGVLSIIASLMMIFDLGAGAVGISTLLGLQVLLAGIALVVFAFAKRNLVGKAKDRIGELKSNFG